MQSKIITIILSILSPISSIVYSLTISTGKQKINNLIISLSLFLSFINTTKLPVSDLAQEFHFFSLAGSLDYIEFLLFRSKEPVYYSFMYISYYLLNGNERIFVFIINFIMFTLFFLSIKKIITRKYKNNFIVIAFILIFAFNPIFFGLSAHTIRQFLAASMIFYFLIDEIYYANGKWWIPILAFLTHTTSLIFLPICVLSKYQTFHKKSYLLSLSVLFLIFLVSIKQIAPFFMGYFDIFFVRYIEQRILQTQYFNLESMTLIHIFFSFALLSLSFFILLFNDKIEDNMIAAITLILNIFILLNLDQTEIAVRFYFYNYFILPFVLVSAFEKKILDIKSFYSIIILSIIVYFFYNLESGVWEYIDYVKIIFLGILPIVFN